MQEHRPTETNGQVSVKEAAALAKVSPQTVHNWMTHGRLQPLQTADGYRVDLEELAHFLAMRRAAAAAGITLDTLRQWTKETSATA
jgi:DNA-binding transcriptional MerR regulator